MSLDKWVELIHSTATDKWNERATAAFDGLFGASGGRYPVAAKSEVSIRAPEIDTEGGVRYAAIIHQSNPSSGRYHGLSFVIFPADGHPCLIGLVVGTDGLTPDEAVLGRPGHSRKARAICDWLNARHAGQQVAWSKQDPTRTDLRVPDGLASAWPEHKRALGRYGAEMYAIYRPDSAFPERTAEAVAAFLDFLFEERGNQPVKEYQAAANQIRNAWFEHVMPSVTRTQVRDLLALRRYVVVQGPPGTGKTRMAGELLREEYGGNGRSVQFHANTTYENFVGGLAPVTDSAAMGLRFAPAMGFLMESAKAALADPNRNYLLHIDEINRADLGKVLGEAIYLLEPDAGQREIDLPYDFGAPFHRKLHLPSNLHIIGTMNSADRSIAILDVAVRRRFAFVSLWPLRSVVQGDPMGEAFERILSIFVEHAPDDVLPLMPGHSYFLKKESLRVGLAPLLEEYLAQGYVSGFAEQVRSYLQWLRALPN